ncbi:hypothetical protein [Phascolarctobacterium faecium]|jgi:hypothetical protein|uniref:hypothetical protein n=1 Tax=Phascolarctobacterium faecium TaxID=33025 RepID=UPI001032ECD3|nr:hypothetical protein [Phascolarctobacterium faecium]
MKMNLTGKIRKIIKALEMRGLIYLYSREQVYSQKLSKVCTMYRIDYLMPWEEYKKKFPDKAERKKNKGVSVRVEMARSFREIDILLYIVDVLKAGDEGGEVNH